MTLAEKLLKRGQLVHQMRQLQEKADAEKRSLNAEELEQWNKLDDEQEKIRLEVEEEKKGAARSTRLAALEGDLKAATTDSGMRPAPAGAARADNVLESKEYRSAVDSYLRGDLDMAGVRARVEARAETLQSGLFIKAGALVMPLEMASGLIKAVDDQTFMLQIARIERLRAAESLGIGTLDTDPDDADWTVELKTGSQADLAVGRRELRPHPLAKSVKVSNTLLRQTSGGAESLVLSRLAYKFGITVEKACMTGTGVQRPLGVFTASADGVTTARDVSTGNTTTAIGADGLIEAKHSLKSAYWPRAKWVFHRDAVKNIRKLKDGNGQYLWQPGLSADLPERILEVPYLVSEYAPNTFTTGLYVGIIGDFSQYVVVIALDMTVQRLVELYAATNQVGFIGRMELDGAPVLAEAFARVKLA